MARVTQLRLYRIEDGRLDDFVAAWKAGVVPLRKAHGFTIEAAWTVHDVSRFVWIVGYDGPLSWEKAEEAYYGSPERAAIDPDPARWVIDPQTWFVTPIDL